MRYLNVDMVDHYYNEEFSCSGLYFDKAHKNYDIHENEFANWTVACKNQKAYDNLIELLDILGFNNNYSESCAKNYHYVNINTCSKIAILGKLDKSPRDYDFNWYAKDLGIYARNDTNNWSRTKVFVVFPSYYRASQFLDWLEKNSYETLDCY